MSAASHQQYEEECEAGGGLVRFTQEDIAMKNLTYVVASAAFLLSAPLAAVAQDASTPQDLLADSLVAMRNSEWLAGVRLAHVALNSRALDAYDTLVATTSLCIQLANAGREGEATEACDRSIALSPERWSGYLNRANLRLMTGDRSRAMMDYAKAQSLNPQQDIAAHSKDQIANGYGGYYVAIVPNGATAFIAQSDAKETP
jgi:hypothetical protein